MMTLSITPWAGTSAAMNHIIRTAALNVECCEAEALRGVSREAVQRTSSGADASGP